jgi:hypothetical protein
MGFDAAGEYSSRMDTNFFAKSTSSPLALLAIGSQSESLSVPSTFYVSPAKGPEVMRSGTFQNMKDGDP